MFVGAGKLQYQFCKRINPINPVYDCANNPANAVCNCQPYRTYLKRLSANRHHLIDTPVQYTMYRLDMILEGANLNAIAIPGDKQAYYESYHTAVLTTDSNNAVGSYNKITYKN